MLKDVEFTDRAALNLTLKKKRMLRPIGFVKAGGGAGDRMLYDADVYGMLISPTNQSLLAAGGNNAGRDYGTMSETGGETKKLQFMQRHSQPLSFGICISSRCQILQQ